MDKALGRRSSLEGGGRRLALAAIVVVAVACGVGCTEGSPSGLAARILERYRKVSGAKPLASAGMIRIRLTPAAGGPARGSSEILWEQARYRETVSSAGWTTVRGVELGKAYFIDADGVTRVLSDPALWELQARSYFWRRAFRKASSSPMMPRRKASTQMTKITPWMIVTHAPSSAR